MSCDCAVRLIGEWRIRVHEAGCTYGAGFTGGEFASRDEQQDGRAATEEALALDGETLLERAKEGE